jgi:SAM-dependent methyltransferase
MVGAVRVSSFSRGKEEFRMPVFAATDPVGYEIYMGRWARRLTDPFLKFVGVKSGQDVIDVGCGTGIFTEAAAKLGANVVGLDPSEAYLNFARNHICRPNVLFENGVGSHLPRMDVCFDVAFSTLVLDIVPLPEQIVVEMRRVTRQAGVVASGAFDMRGGFAPFMMLLDTAAVLDEAARELRDTVLSCGIVWPNGPSSLWRKVGLVEVQELPIVATFDYSSFDDYWATFVSGQGRWGSYVMSLEGERRSEVQRLVKRAYPSGMADGPRSFSVIFRAVRGLVPR